MQNLLEAQHLGVIENLRNKYKNHPVIRPIIYYCEENSLGFEFIKETRLAIGIKSYRYVSTYYMKIGDNLIEADTEIWSWDDLFQLIVKAYEYLGLEYPDNLIRVARVFRKSL